MRDKKKPQSRQSLGTFKEREAHFQQNDTAGSACGDNKPRLFILPEFLLEMYLTPSQAPEARRRRRRKMDKVFISLFSTGTFRKRT